MKDKKPAKKDKNSAKVAVYILGLAATIIVIILPFIIEKVYYMKPPCDFFQVDYDAKDILSYYGSVLSFLGATILGILTLRQNKIAQEKSDEVNRLQLELQRKSMAMAEAQYSKIQSSNSAPKFEVSLLGYDSCYANFSLAIKNVSPMITSCLTAISVTASDKDGAEIAKAKKMEFRQHSLSTTQKTVLKTDFPELAIRRMGKIISYYTDISLSCSFSCEDENGNTHYYRASVLVPTTKDYIKGPWLVKIVG